MPGCGSGVVVCSSSLLFRDHPGRRQAETPLHEVVILCGGVEIARHPRCYGEGAFVADPLHYLALIETKPGALDQAAALQGWDLPEVFQHLRHLLEARMGNRGKREFIQVLRLLEALPLDIVTAAG